MLFFRVWLLFARIGRKKAEPDHTVFSLGTEIPRMTPFTEQGSALSMLMIDWDFATPKNVTPNELANAGGLVMTVGTHHAFELLDARTFDVVIVTQDAQDRNPNLVNDLRRIHPCSRLIVNSGHNRLHTALSVAFKLPFALAAVYVRKLLFRT